LAALLVEEQALLAPVEEQK